MTDPKRVSVEVQFSAVDPAVMGLLTGGAFGTPPDPTFALETWTPVKRTFWQWLRRRPRQYHYVLIPNARLNQISHPADGFSLTKFNPTGLTEETP